MKTDNMIEGKCDICKEPIKSAPNQAQFNRNLGLHKRKVHNIASPKAATARRYLKNKIRRIVDPASRQNGHLNTLLSKPPIDLVEPNQKRKYTRRQLRDFVPQTPKTSEAIPAKLSECPCCGTRFYMVRGTTA